MVQLMTRKILALLLLFFLSVSIYSQEYNLSNNIILIGKNTFRLPSRNNIPVINNLDTEYGTAYLARILFQGKIMIAGGREAGYFFNHLAFNGRPYRTGDLTGIDYRNIVNLYVSYNLIQRKNWKHNFFVGLGPSFRDATEIYWDLEINWGGTTHEYYYGRIGRDWGFLASIDYQFRPFKHWLIMPSVRYYTYPWWKNTNPTPDPRASKPLDMIGFGIYAGFAF